jgi:hypothetical protein
MFSFKRFSEQFKIILMQNAQKQGLYLVVICLTLIYCHYVLFHSDGRNFPLGLDFWGFVIALMTIINSTNVFAALLRTDSGIHYYMTPASIGEKYAAAWLYSFAFTVVIYASVIGLVHLISIPLGNLITGLALPYSFPDPSKVWDNFQDLMLFQSLFFLGALVFKKNPFGKTLLTIIVCGFAISLISSIIIGKYLTHGTELSNSVSFNWNNHNSHPDFINGTDFPEVMENLWQTVKVILTVIPFICWIAGYYRLKTREV